MPGNAGLGRVATRPTMACQVDGARERSARGLWPVSLHYQFEPSACSPPSVSDQRCSGVPVGFQRRAMLMGAAMRARGVAFPRDRADRKATPAEGVALPPIAPAPSPIRGRIGGEIAAVPPKSWPWRRPETVGSPQGVPTGHRPG
jgi:hypothetical protein